MIARIVALSMVMLTSSALAENVFPLGIWYEGGVGAFRNTLIPDDPQQAAKQYDRDFADIAAHGINLVVVPNTPREHHQILLDTAKKHGLKLIIELGTDGDALGAMVRGSKPLSDAAVKSVLDEKLKPLADH